MTRLAGTRPFITRFAMPIGGSEPQPLRYDAERQISQLLVNGEWLDATSTGMTTGGSTRHTKVNNETTDDD